MLWNNSARLLLIRSISNHPSVLSIPKQDQRRVEAWWHIYREMVSYGMPPMSTHMLESSWNHILAKSMERIRENSALDAVDTAVKMLMAQFSIPSNSLAVRSKTTKVTRTVAFDRRTGRPVTYEREVSVDSVANRAGGRRLKSFGSKIIDLTKDRSESGYNRPTVEPSTSTKQTTAAEYVAAEAAVPVFDSVQDTQSRSAAARSLEKLRFQIKIFEKDAELANLRLGHAKRQLELLTAICAIEARNDTVA